MQKNTSVTGSEVVRAGLRSSEENKETFFVLRTLLKKGEDQLDRGEGIDGEILFNELLQKETK